MELYNDAMRYFDDHLLLETLSAYLDGLVIKRAEEAKRDGSITRLLGTKNWVWKTRTGNRTISIKSKYGVVQVRSIQVRTQDGGAKNLTRWLLGLEAFVRIPPLTQRVLANLATHCRFRAVRILSGVKVSLQSISKAVFMTADRVRFASNPKERQVYQGDGTGAPVVGAGKAYETQLLMQEYHDGSMHPVATQTCLRASGWRTLLRRIVTRSKKAVLVHDGDVGINYAFAQERFPLRRQVCLWHLYYSVKRSTLYMDFRNHKDWKAEYRSSVRSYVLRRLYSIVYSTGVQVPLTVTRRLNLLANKCLKLGLVATATYLREAAPFLQTARELGVHSCTTSKTERAFRTINDRLDRGSWWSPRGVDAITKLRLDWFYNRSYLDD